MTDPIYTDRCPCCNNALKHYSDYMEHILLTSEYECPRCGWYSCYDTGRYEVSFMGRWIIGSHYTYSYEQFQKAQNKERSKERIWKYAWPVLKPLFAFLNKIGR